jgi:hypothetical protein
LHSGDYCGKAALRIQVNTVVYHPMGLEPHQARMVAILQHNADCSAIHVYIIVNLTAFYKDNVYCINLAFSYGSYYDSKTQQLHIWLTDASLVKPGKTALTFGAVYAGQGVEGSKNEPKPRDLKLSITIQR